MRIYKSHYFLLFFISAILLCWTNIGCSDLPASVVTGPVYYAPIGGCNLVAPSNPISQDDLASINEIEAGWISVIPYGFSVPGETYVRYNNPGQWWGEREEGVRAQIEYSHNLGLKVMVKPHVWVMGQGWAGDFELDNEDDWATWETDYEAYILYFAEIAEDLNCEMFCIGTEFRKSATQRPLFWGELADKVRSKFSGKITYAANWDNYKKIEFWDHLDYIGVDAYFPLSPEKNPSVEVLNREWEPIKSELHALSQKLNKQVIFTEYGYLCVDGACWRNWELEGSLGTLAYNSQAQQNGFESLYQTFWNEPWFAGGFLWVWHANHNSAGGNGDTDYTPQNKPVMTTIRNWYSRSKEQN